MAKSLLYIIGNGFDLAQGLKSRYKDFYPYYLKQESSNEAVKLLKKEIKDNIGDWSDMELALGKFTQLVESESLFTELYYDLCENLSAYLQAETEKRRFALNPKILGDFFDPNRYLEPIDQRTYQEHFARLIDKDMGRVSVNVITLNYTDTIEKLTGFSGASHMSFDSVFYWINGICHRHGRIGDTILLGVNDEKQIANEAFKQNVMVKECLIKPTSIMSMRSENDLLCKDMIDNAGIIVLFGVSLGETDACLWNDVVQSLDRKDPALIVYFHHSSVIIPTTRKQLLGRKEAEVRKLLYKRLGVPETHQSDREILVGYNKKIFVDEENTKNSPVLKMG